MSNPLLKANTTGIKTTLIKEGGFSKELNPGPYYNANDILLKAIEEGIEKDGEYPLIAKNENDPIDDIYQNNLAQRRIETTTDQVKQLNLNYNENGIQIGDDNINGVFWEKPAYFSDDCTYYPLGSNGSSMDSLMLASSRNNNFLKFNYEDSLKALEFEGNDLVSINSKNTKYDNNIWGDYRGIQISEFKENLLKFQDNKRLVTLNLKDGFFDENLELSKESFDHIEIIPIDENGNKSEALKKDEDFEVIEKVIEKKKIVEIKSLKKIEAYSLEATLYTYSTDWTSYWYNKDYEEITNNFLLAEDALKIRPRGSNEETCFFKKKISIDKEGYYSFSCYIKASSNTKIQFGFKKENSFISNDSEFFSELEIEKSSNTFSLDTEWRRYGVISYLNSEDYDLGISWTASNYKNESNPSLSIMALKLEEGFFSNYDFRDISYSGDLINIPKKHILSFYWPTLLNKSSWAITYLRYIPGINGFKSTLQTLFQKCVDTIGNINLGYKNGEIIAPTDAVIKRPDNLEPYNRWERVLLEYNNGTLTYTVLSSEDLGKENYFYSCNIPFESANIKNVFAGSYDYNLLLGADLDENNSVNTYNAFYRGLAFFDKELTKSQKRDILYTYMKLDYIDPDPESSFAPKIALRSEHLTETDITNLK